MSLDSEMGLEPGKKMTFEQIKVKVDLIDQDATLQNLIAQANARYILYNTSEDHDNFPNYTIKDEKLNILAFQYLTLGCRFIEIGFRKEGIPPLEKGASILEYCHGSVEEKTRLGGYYGLISALSYYVCFQYSKAFVLIKKVDNDTLIARLVSLFLSRNYDQLLNMIQDMAVNEKYSDTYVSKLVSDIDASRQVYEITIARSLNNFVRYFFSGDKALLETARFYLENLKEITSIKREPDIWWVARLLILITDGFAESSLWNSLNGYFDTTEGLPKQYIQSLTYKKNGGVYELFITQRNSLSKALNPNKDGCVISIPTSSGKTRIAEIAILDCLNENIESKILYIAPFRSLAFEVENGLDGIFHSMGISVSHLYGGSLFSKLDEKVIEDSHVIVATPEKAKAMLRGNSDILNQIKLVVVDEGHLLGTNKRLIMNEIFYEELRFYINRNAGKFMVLSAVLPNAEDLALWLTGSTDNVFRENWRPSDERLGILQWNGDSVDLNWRSTDTERNSFNPRFVVSEEQPLKGREYKVKYFPGSKNQGIAATAYKLRKFGTVLVFVGLKASVFTIAREYEKCLTGEALFDYKNQHDWRAFELACIEAYGADSLWLKYARKGILCHNAGLLSDVRLPLERLMSKEKPLVIIATSTLGQGVNLGVSTVIFSTLYQAGDLITSRDFWNIAGRAGRAFVDHEGKILVALDAVGKSNWRLTQERKRIIEYFDKTKINKAQSGCLELVKALKVAADSNDISFEMLIELIANNNIEDIHENSDRINELFDWIDDGLLALHDINSLSTDDFGWMDDYLRNSLAYIQAENDPKITGDEVIQFMKARTKGIIAKVGDNRDKWKSIIQSGIPLNSDLQIEEKLPTLIKIIQGHLELEQNVDNKILLLKAIEDEINEINVLSEVFLNSKDADDIRRNWITAVPISDFSPSENTLEIITKHYAFSLPWVLNGISKKLGILGLEAEADEIEELSILVEVGVPNLKSVKVYQSGIRSRSSACELAEQFDDELWDKSIQFYKNSLINDAETYKVLVSNEAGEWLDLLTRFSKREMDVIKPVPDFQFPEVHKETTRLIAREINGTQYLSSPDFRIIKDVNDGEIDFSSINHVNGVFFEYNEDGEVWKMINMNPYLRFEK